MTREGHDVDDLENGLRDTIGTNAMEDLEKSAEEGRPLGTDEGRSAVGTEPQYIARPSTRRFIAFVIVALLLAGAVVAHLLTGPGLRLH